MKDVQCYELFGGIAHKNHAFSFHIYRCVHMQLKAICYLVKLLNLIFLHCNPYFCFDCVIC